MLPLKAYFFFVYLVPCGMPAFPVEVVTLSGARVFDDLAPDDWSIRDVEEAVLSVREGQEVRLFQWGEELPGDCLVHDRVIPGLQLTAVVSSVLTRAETFQLRLGDVAQVKKFLRSVKHRGAPRPTLEYVRVRR